MAAEPFQAFISYSRGASQSLAVDLQTGIERFAKPWYRLRGLRIFRDDSSMSANTALWSTIETGLRQSEWFILLATPEAAASGYVNNEIDWWLRHKGPQRLLIVQSAGDLFWDRALGRFDPRSTAVPPLLHAAYPEEPRWVDMRWYGSVLVSEGAATAKADPRFTERVADLTAAIRGVERDTLIGENVRQHRRALRLARSAIVVLAGLLVLSVIASIFAVDQRNTARDQATIARARQLAATARTLIPNDIGKARLLAVEAYRLSPDDQTESALLETDTASPQLVRQFAAGGEVWSTAGTADGRLVFAATRQGAVIGWDVASGRRTDFGQLPTQPTSLSVSADGSVVVAATGHAVRIWTDGEPVPVPSGLPADLTSAVVTSDGSAIVVASSFDDPVVRTLRRAGASYRLDPDPIPFGFWATHLSVAGQTVTAWDEDSGVAERRDLRTGALLSRAEGLNGSVAQYPGELSPDGEFAAVPEGSNTGNMPIYRTDRTHRTEAASQLIGYALGQPQAAVAISPKATFSAYAFADTIQVAPTQAPSPSPFAVTVLRGISATGTNSLRFLSDRFLVSGSDTRLMLFDLDQHTPLVSTTSSRVDLVSQADVAPAIVANHSGTAFATLGWPSGFSLTRLPGGAVATAPATSTFVAWRDDGSLFYADGAGRRLCLFDLASATITQSWLLDWPTVAEGRYDVWSGRYIAASNELLLSGTKQFAAFDAATGAVRRPAADLSYASFSIDGRYAFGADHGDLNRPTVLDLSSQKSTVVAGPVPLDDSLTGRGLFSGYQGGVLELVSELPRDRTFWSVDGLTRLGDGPPVNDPSVRITVSPDGLRYAAHRSDESIAITTLSGGAPVGTFAIPYDDGKISYTYAGDGQHLLVAIPQGTTTDDPHNPHGLVLSIDLTPAGWIAAACRTAGRDLEPAEWTALTGSPAPADLRCAR